MEYNFKKELKRKIFHFFALLPICFFVYFIENKHFNKIFPFVLIVFIFDFFNLYFVLERKNIKICNFFFSLLREHERKKYTLNGSTWILISILFCFFFNFEKNIQFIGFFILAFSDSLAALFGKKYGKIKIFNKTLEGGIVFFLSSFFIILISHYSNNFNIEHFVQSFIIAILLSILELFADKIRSNDNFLIPISFCILIKLWDNFIHRYFFCN